MSDGIFIPFRSVPFHPILFHLKRRVNAQYHALHPHPHPLSLSSLRLKPLLHAPSNRPQVTVHLTRLLSQDQADDALAGDVDVLETAEDVDLLVCEDDTGAACVFDGELCFAVLAGDTSNGTAWVWS
jgi:hypothetical protein